MHRLLVALLAAVDAAIAVAVGLAATLAPLTLLWVFGFGGVADWSALWPTGATVWQFGNLVPLAVALPLEYVTAVGIDPGAASFTLSLAPLAFAGFTIVFAVRSGARASRAEAWATGVATSTLVVAVLSTLVALTSAGDIAAAALWQAILYPMLLFGVPALASAVVVEWAEAGGGAVARVRDRIEASDAWADVPALVARGTAVVVVGLLGLGAVLVAVALLLRGGEIVALYETAHLDLVGATVMTLGQLAYLPTLVVWGVAFLAGPGFAVGTATEVSPAGTQVGVLPGIPMLGVIPESITPWLLLLALLPVALGAFAGWIARSRLVAGAQPDTLRGPAGVRDDVADPTVAASLDTTRTAALAGLLGAGEPVWTREGDDAEHDRGREEASDPIGPRAVIALGIAVLSAAAAAVLAVFASGSLGPGALAEVGPAAGPVALAVGAEVGVGAAILLLSPRRRPRGASRRRPGRGSKTDGGGPEPRGSDRDDEQSGISRDADAEAPAPEPADAWAPDSTTEPLDLPTAPERLGRVTRPGPLGDPGGGTDRR